MTASGPSDSPDPDAPWSEAEWELFLRRADARAARMGELMETIGEAPDADEQLAREMGWGEPPEMDEDEFDAADDDPEPPAPAATSVPAYALAKRVAVEALRLVRSAPDDEDWNDLRDAALAMPLHLARSLPLADSADTLNGQIVLTRWAIASGRSAAAAIERLRSQGKINPRQVRSLERSLAEAMTETEGHLFELRKRAK